jgi:hypothetical protein
LFPGSFERLMMRNVRFAHLCADLLFLFRGECDE